MLSLMVTIFILSSCQKEPRVADIHWGFFPPFSYANLEGLLIDIALIRFDEASRFGVDRGPRDELLGLRNLYMPVNVPESVPLQSIVVDVNTFNAPIHFNYSIDNVDATPHQNITASLTWYRNMFRPIGEVVIHSPERGRYNWSQYGYAFSANVPIRLPLPEEDRYTLTSRLINPQPIIAWEIKGSAISILIQGMENVAIYDENGYEIISMPTLQDRRYTSNVFSNVAQELEHHSLYRNNGENEGIVGYSWLVDVYSLRYQFVLKPGTYVIYAEGISGEPDLLIKHFYEREIVSSVSKSRELSNQNFSRLKITVISDSGGNSDVIAIEL